MPALDFGLSSYKRGRGDLPELPVINMFAEETPTEETGIILQSRSPLVDMETDLDDGPVQALFQADGVLDSPLFAVSGGALYRDGAYVGALDGDGPFFMDAYRDRLFIAGGQSLWGYDGAALVQIPIPDNQDVLKVVVGASRALVIVRGSEQFYWSDPLGDTFEGLAFSSAESQPDNILDILFINDMAILFGAATVEMHPNTNDANLPFAPLESAVMEVGVRNTGSACPFGPSFAWVTSEHRICVQSETNVISNEGLEKRIKASETCTLWTFYIDATECLALTIDGETQVLHSRSGRFSEFASYGHDNWVPGCFAGGLFGSSVDGRLLRFSDDEGGADLGAMFERRFRAGMPINSGAVPVNNVFIRCNPGQTPFLTGDYDDPVVEMRISRDGGHTWGVWRQASLGTMGQYRKLVEWRACGIASQPSLLIEFRCTDPVPLRISGVIANEGRGGR